MGPAGTPDWKIDTTAASFEQDVVEQSLRRAVLVDFWAEWCQPCRVLAPVLEAIADEYQGKFALVKANVEELQEIAGRYGVQSIPAVQGFVGGQRMEGFVGVQPPEAIRSFVDVLLDFTELTRASDLEQSDPANALLRYAPLRSHRRLAESASMGSARCLLALGRLDEARAIVDEWEDVAVDRAGVQRLRARLDLAEAGDSSLEELCAAWQKTPSDLELRLALARALAAEDRHEEALEHALEIVRADRQGVGEPARRLMVDVFHLLPADSDLVRRFRQDLASALF